MTILAFLLLAVCHGVQGDAILGRDLAAADARFAAVPAEEHIGYAPMPGAQRTLSAMELKRVAQRFAIEGEFDNMCFAYPLRRIETAEMLSAMQDSLKADSAQVEIVEFSLYGAPAGVLLFPMSGLSRPSPVRVDEPVMWRGYVEYPAHAGAVRKFNVWAKVRVTIEQSRIVAQQDLPAARIVEASQVRLERVRAFPAAETVAGTVEQVAGHTLRRPVRKDAPVPMDALEAAVAHQVTRGEVVEVDVEAGLTHLKFEGRAESNGEMGTVVTVRNAKSGKAFSGRVVGKGKVEVIAGTGE